VLAEKNGGIAIMKSVVREFHRTGYRRVL